VAHGVGYVHSVNEVYLIDVPDHEVDCHVSSEIGGEDREEREIWDVETHGGGQKFEQQFLRLNSDGHSVKRTPIVESNFWKTT
jgi:hypothetical protein